MLEKPENWDQLTPEEKRSKRLEAWAAGDHIEFTTPENKQIYQYRANLIKDAVELKKAPDRVPITGLQGSYIFSRAGVKQKDTLYDNWDKAADAFVDFHAEFEPDSSSPLFFMAGSAMEILDQTNLKWPGCHLPDDIQYQFVENEYMKEDEYPLFIADPSDFYLRYFWPRMNAGLKGLKKFPKLTSESIGFGIARMAFLDEELHEAFAILKKSAELSLPPFMAAEKAYARLHQMGFPSFWKGMGAAPYDILGDNLRGTRGIMMDLFRRPNDILAACEKILEEVTIQDQPLGEAPFYLMPLHKGAEGFMSKDQYEKFYWPTFKAAMLKIIEKGLIPVPFAEGSFNERLEYIKELPKASTIWYFDKMDMRYVKEVLGDTCCIMGNVPISMVATGSAQDVTKCCKDLIDNCGQGGGFILSTSCQLDHAQDETVRAMVETAKTYNPHKG
jgi:hypothetical protein